MAKIEIKDLEENIKLDNQAMASILGGKSQGKASTSTMLRKFDRLNPAWLTRLMTQDVH